MDSIHAVFAEAGLMEHEEHVKIHATLLNSRHGESAHGPWTGDCPARFHHAQPDILRLCFFCLSTANTKRRTTFDASVILEALADYDFGTAVMDTLHLSQMRRERNDYYVAEATAPLASSKT
jgi:hypothetical protein